MICTFYSFKGGTGRSMALANVARWLTMQGISVTMVDWDLEAPGLEAFFTSTPEELELIGSKLGLIDMLASYKRRFRTIAEEVSAGDAGFVAALDQHLPELDGLLHTMPASTSSAAPLRLLTAGWRAGDRLDAYGAAVQSLDWNELYDAYEGEAYFEWLRGRLLASGDVVLIDSRTGFTEMGGVCTRQLADVVVSLCAPNAQNLAGVAAMTESFKNQRLLDKRGRDLDVIIVPTRLDVSEVDARKRFEEEFRTVADPFTPLAFQRHRRDFWQLRIPYIPLYAYGERIAVDDETTVEELVAAYQHLAAHIALLAPPEAVALRGVWDRFWRAATVQDHTPVTTVFRVPPPVPHLTGRGDELDEVRRRLEADGLLVLTGLAGVGTTALAVEHAHRRREDYDVAWMMDASSREALAAGWEALASALALVPTRRTSAAEVCRLWLERNGRWLLILDGAERPEDVRAQLPSLRHGHVLVTSRDATWATQAPTLPVLELGAAEAAGVLGARFSDVDADVRVALASRLGGLPLALEVAGDYAKASGRSLERVLALVEDRAPRVLEPALAPLLEGVAWVDGQDPVAAELLRLCAQLGSQPIPVGVMLEAAAGLPEPLAAAASDPFALDEALAALRRRSLVRVEGDAVLVHPLVALACRERLAPEETARWAELALVASARGSTQEPRLLPHAAAALRRVVRTDGRPGSEAGAHDHEVALALDVLARQLDDVAWPDESLTAAGGAVVRWRRILAAEPQAFRRELAAALERLATRLGDAGKPDEALAQIEEAVAIRRGLAEESPEQHDAGLANALTALSECLAHVGRYGEALSAAGESARMWQDIEISGSALSERAAALSVLAQRLADVGRYDASREEAAAAAETWRAVAETHPVDRGLYPLLTTRDVEGVFAELGVEAIRRARQVIGFLVVEGRKTLPLHYVRDRPVLPGHVPDRFRSALRLEPKELDALVAGELRRDGYLALLEQRVDASGTDGADAPG